MQREREPADREERALSLTTRRSESLDMTADSAPIIETSALMIHNLLRRRRRSPSRFSNGLIGRAERTRFFLAGHSERNAVVNDNRRALSRARARACIIIYK
jgi:hypothetical protein